MLKTRKLILLIVAVSVILALGSWATLKAKTNTPKTKTPISI